MTDATTTTAAMATATPRREVALDLMRIAAALAVVLLHAASQYFKESFPSTEWDIRIVYNAMSRWCVPVFLMISGALFLDGARPLRLRHLFGKNLLRIVVAFAVWSYIYSFEKIHAGPPAKSLALWLAGPSHFWYLKMLVGIYISIPIFRAITANKRTEQYFIVLALVTTFVIPFALTMGRQCCPASVIDPLQRFYNALHLDVAAGYSGYFIIGHYLHTYHPTPRGRRIIYALGVGALVLMVVGSILASHQTGKPVNWFINYLTPTVLLEAVAVFVFFSSKSWRLGERPQRWLTQAARMSFGIYLVHVLYIRTGVLHGYTSSWLHPAYFIPIYTLAIFAISYLTTWLLSKIPYLNRHLI